MSSMDAAEAIRMVRLYHGLGDHLVAYVRERGCHDLANQVQELVWGGPVGRASVDAQAIFYSMVQLAAKASLACDDNPTTIELKATRL